MTLQKRFKHPLRKRLYGKADFAYAYKLSITLFTLAITAFARAQVISTLPARQKPIQPGKHTAPAAQEPVNHLWQHHQILNRITTLYLFELTVLVLVETMAKTLKYQ